MGWRKFHLGSIKKNEERKKLVTKKRKPGRPIKSKKVAQLGGCDSSADVNLERADSDNKNIIPPTQWDSFLTALDLQQLHPTLGQEQTPLPSSTSSTTTSRSHSQASKSETDNITASNSRQSVQLLTAPSHKSHKFGVSVKRISKEVYFQKDLDLEINCGTETILSSPSPLATRTSKALLLYNCCHDNNAAPTMISRLIDPLTSAPPTEVTVLGKRRARLPPCNSNTSLFKKSKTDVGLPKKMVCMKVLPPRGEFLPVVHSRRGAGQVLSGTFSCARV